MDKAYTPQKDPKSAVRNTAAQSYIRKTPDSVSRAPAPASELALLKDYQSLKIQVRQLEAKNRTLSSEVQQLLYQKSYSENKFIQKMNFQQQTLAQFHKQKNYQIELLQIKHQEQLSRIKRQSQLRADQYLRDIKHKDYLLKQRDEQIRYLELRNQQIRKDYDILDGELVKSRQQCAIITQNLTHNQFANKKLEMLVEELEIQKSEMQAEIRVLLDIEAEKSRDINNLENRLRKSEDNERRLTDKLSVLSENFTQLQNHITIMKGKLLNADEQNHSLLQQLERAQLQIKEKQHQILQQNDRQSQLRIQLEQHQKREVRRDRQVAELMAQNQRLYKDLNYNRHRLHDMGVAYGFDV